MHSPGTVCVTSILSDQDLTEPLLMQHGQKCFPRVGALISDMKVQIIALSSPSLTRPESREEVSSDSTEGCAKIQKSEK